MRFHCSCGYGNIVVTEDSRLACDNCGGSFGRVACETSLLTSEQRAQNIAELEAYTKPAMIPDGAPWPAVLRALQICASLHDDRVRLVGNLRADDIKRACGEALAALGGKDGAK